MKNLSVAITVAIMLCLSNAGHAQVEKEKKPGSDIKMPVAKAKPLFAKLQDDEVRVLAFSPNGRLLAVGGGAYNLTHLNRPGFVNLWDTKTGGLLVSLQAHDHLSACLAFSPDGKTLASGGDGLGLILWDVETHKERSAFSSYRVGEKEQPFDYIWDLTYSPDNRYLAWGGGRRRPIEWRDLETGQILRPPILPDGFVPGGIFFSPRGDLLALIGQEVTEPDNVPPGRLVLWDFLAKEERWSRTMPRPNQLEGLSADLSRMAISLSRMDYKPNRFYPFDRVCILETATGKEITSFRPNEHTIPQEPADCGAMSPDGRFFVLGSGPVPPADNTGGVVAIWDLEQGKEIAAFVAHTDSVEAVSFSADGKLLATAGSDRYVKVWNFGSLLPVERVDGKSLKAR